ncbi:MAG: hypothetical protein FWC17_05015, partial [Treponema sp.]|nr:hypothetical protein [Treponema sp.]
FTLFDQVVSFSAGNIKSALIREKLGITGLEKLNALSQSCAENDAAKAFALMDEILSSGVAVEQFIIDLAGYYRSLLLIKNGVTRESLLGCRPSLFSAQVIEAFDSIRLEQALDILLDCYRDMRYSVSPRFEAETAVSKLAWLGKWVSPAELKSALDGAKAVFAGNGTQQIPRSGPQQNQAQQISHNEPQKQSEPKPAQQVSNNEKPVTRFSDTRSLSDAFNKMVAAKENGAAPGSSDDDDVPMWDNAASRIPPDSEKAESGNPVDNVLSVIPGVVVS